MHTTKRIILSGGIKDNIELAKKAGSVLYLDARKSDGIGFPTNSPLTNPWVDLIGNKTSITLINLLGTDGNFDANDDRVGVDGIEILGTDGNEGT